MYSSLLEYYDELFPVEKSRLDFIESIAAEYKKEKGLTNPVKILDLGCATGMTSIQLMRRGMDLVGIDNNDQMIQSASRRNPEPKTNARFFLMDMTKIDTYFPKNSFDIVLCLGNTLVHLDGLEQIEQQIKSIHSVLKSGGVFIFQIINYDMVLKEHMVSLPVIETTRSSFVRKYSSTEDGYIQFDASVLSANGQTVFSSSVDLFPLSSKDLSGALNSSGFKNETYYSDFEKNPLTNSSLAIVGTSVKA